MSLFKKRALFWSSIEMFRLNSPEIFYSMFFWPLLWIIWPMLRTWPNWRRRKGRREKRQERRSKLWEWRAPTPSWSWTRMARWPITVQHRTRPQHWTSRLPSCTPLVPWTETASWGFDEQIFFKLQIFNLWFWCWWEEAQVGCNARFLALWRSSNKIYS